MGAAYTPGLKVTARATVLKPRRLPIKGTVLVKTGDRVVARDLVASTDLPGKVYPCNIGGNLGINAEELPDVMLKKAGEAVTKGEILAETRGMFGLFKSQFHSPIDGTVESVSKVTGQVMLREKPTPVTVSAYVDGVVAEVIPDEGVVVKAQGTFIQGIFGLGGETHGPIKVLVDSVDVDLDPARLDASCKGAVVIGGAYASLAALKKAREVGVAAVVVGGFHYNDVRDLLGYDLGVAITGGEKLGITLIVTEGFGRIPMARRTYALLKAAEGRVASVNGATQIRAGVIRPEVIVPSAEAPTGGADEEIPSLAIGSPIRVIRFPRFGKIGKVTALPVELQAMESETMVRVLEVQFDDGEKMIVPRANVEMIEE